MSRLTDQLATLGQVSRPTMGFGRAGHARHNAAMLLITQAQASHPRSQLEEVGPFVDAFVLDAAAGSPVPPAATLDALEGKTWGISGCGAASDDLDALKTAGCDFILIAGDDTPGAVLRDDGMERGFTIQPGLSEERARALEDLPFEFVVLEARDESWPISLAGLMRLQETVSMVNKHIFLRVSQLPPADDLALLRDMPVSALLVDLSAVDRAAMSAEREALDGLEPRKPRQPLEQTPMLGPQPGLAAPSGADSGGDEDWDGEYGDHAGEFLPR